MKKITLQIKEMHCESCAKTIEKAILKEKGVILANVIFSLGKAIIEYDPKETKIEKIKKAIKKAGYEALEKEGEMKDEIKKGWQRFWLGLVLTIPVFVIETILQKQGFS